MKKIITSAVIIFITQNVFAEAIYETNTNGVASFSNDKTKGAKIVNLKSDPITVLNPGSQQQIATRTIYQNKISPSYRPYPSYTHQDTLQGSFPEQLTDNYFDFYGRNHHYESLMSSTHNGGFYDSSGANNGRLRNNY